MCKHFFNYMFLFFYLYTNIRSTWIMIKSKFCSKPRNILISVFCHIAHRNINLHLNPILSNIIISEFLSDKSDSRKKKVIKFNVDWNFTFDNTEILPALQKKNTFFQCILEFTSLQQKLWFNIFHKSIKRSQLLKIYIFYIFLGTSWHCLNRTFEKEDPFGVFCDNLWKSIYNTIHLLWEILNDFWATCMFVFTLPFTSEGFFLPTF